MQCKHIDTDKLLALLHAMSYEPQEGVFGPRSVPHWVMVYGVWEFWNDRVALTPYRVMSAKLGRLYRKGLINGYGGHCYRGDLELTRAGHDRLMEYSNDF